MSPVESSAPPFLTLQVPGKHDTTNGRPQDRVSTSSFNFHGIDLSSFDSDLGATLAAFTPVTSPSSPPASPRLQRDQSKNFLSNFKTRVSPESEKKSSKSLGREGKGEQQDPDAYRPGTSGMSKIYHLKKNPGSTPELNLVGSSQNVSKDESELSALPPPPPGSQASGHYSEDNNTAKRKENRGFRNPLIRSKSIRRDSGSKPRSQDASIEQPPKTAPLSQEWPDSGFLRPKAKEKRGKSADRSGASESEDHLPMARDKSQNTFVSGSKQVMSRAKTGGGHLLNRLGKITRSGSSHEKEIPDNEYVLKVINLPLVEQTRITRISKAIESCRDKTEYWMPSLPWRCIDYLNLNCEHEGLYRVPGSSPEVKRWQRRFDTEFDVDLLDETELYDPNTIASMLKSWLRDLPSEIMPKSFQHALGEELSKDNPNYQRLGEPVPQKLRNALSQLPPFNYYLLFAITCHLNLLLSHKDKNKMDLNNLSICIGPPLDLERWLFNYLVGEWRNCWQGCFTEKRYLEVERGRAEGVDVHDLPFPEGGFDFNLGPEQHTEDGTPLRSAGSDPVPEIPKRFAPPTSRSESLYEDASSSIGNATGAASSATTEMSGLDTSQLPVFAPSSSAHADADRPSTSGGADGKSGSTSAKRSGHRRSRSELPSLHSGKGSVDFTLPIMH